MVNNLTLKSQFSIQINQKMRWNVKKTKRKNSWEFNGMKSPGVVICLNIQLHSSKIQDFRLFEKMFVE